MAINTLGRVYANGEVIVRQGEPGSTMYVIQDGEVEVVREGDGGETRLAMLKTGDIFGEMSLFEKETRSATVRSVGEARVLTVDKRTFIRRIREDPFIAFNLLRAMSRRIRRLDEEVHRLSSAARPRPSPATD